jgi:hypothetical protein
MMEFWLCNTYGDRIGILDRVIQASYVKGVNSTGAFDILLPAEQYSQAKIDLDYLVEIWRDGILEGVGWIRKLVFEESATQTLRILGPDQNTVLDRRIVAYAAGTPQAYKAGKADDFMKAIVRENLGNLSIAARAYSSLGLIVDSDTGLGPVVEKGFSWTNVHQVLSELSDAAVTAGTPIYFYVTPFFSLTTGLGLSFRTFLNQPGADRSVGSASPLILGYQWGNMTDIVMEYDWSVWDTHIYAGGQGEGTQRVIVEVSSASETYTVWNRWEKFVDARDQDTLAGVTQRANEALAAGRSRLRFSGRILSLPGSLYGIDWNLGDRITAEHRGWTLSGIIRSVRISLDSNGLESIEAKFEI